jgi:hypothetical protein
MSSPIENAVLTIDSMYPWAKEVTLDKVFAHALKTNLLLNQALVQMGKGKDISADIVNAFNIERDGALTSILKKSSTGFDKTIKGISRDTNPLSTVANIAEDFAWAVQESTDNLARNSIISTLAPVVSKTAIIAGVGVAGTFTVARMIAEYATEQEKSLRAMIGLGIVAGDMNMYTDFRDSAASLSMSFGSMIDTLQEFNMSIARLSNNTTTGYNNFLDFVNNVDSGEAGISNFGYTGQQLARRLSEEARVLTRSGQIDSLNNSARAKIADSFQKITAFAIGMANSTGIERDKLLEARSNALNEVSHIVAINKFAGLLINDENKNAVRRSEMAYGELAQVSEMLGPDMAKQLLEWVDRTQYDIDVNTTSLDNIQQSLQNTLTFLGPDAVGIFASIVEKTAFGHYENPGELSYDFQQALTYLRESRPDFRITFNETTSAAGHVRDMAWLASEEFMNASKSQLNFTPELVNRATVTAGAVVQGIDDAREAMLRVYSDLAPGFEATGNVASTFGNKLTALQDIWSDIFNVTEINVTTRQDRAAQARQDRIQSNNFLQGKTDLSYDDAVRLSSSMASQTGVVSGSTLGYSGISSTTSGASRSGGGYSPINVTSSQPWAQDREFLAEVDRVAQRFGFNPNALLGLMASESGINPQARNTNGGATGLIQFMPSTARGLGTTTDHLITLTRAQQMPWVEKYFEPYASNLAGASAGKLYAYVFLPGRAHRDVLTSRGENYYNQNVGLDMNRDGAITISDLDQRVAKSASSRGIDLSSSSVPEVQIENTTPVPVPVDIHPTDFEPPDPVDRTSAPALPPPEGVAPVRETVVTPMTTEVPAAPNMPELALEPEPALAPESAIPNTNGTWLERLMDWPSVFGGDDEISAPIQPTAPLLAPTAIEDPINTNTIPDTALDNETLEDLRSVDEEIRNTALRITDTMITNEAVERTTN